MGCRRSSEYLANSADYNKYRFIENATNPPKPMCPISHIPISNEAMKPSKIPDQLNKVHSHKKGTEVIYF